MTRALKKNMILFSIDGSTPPAYLQHLQMHSVPRVQSHSPWLSQNEVLIHLCTQALNESQTSPDIKIDFVQIWHIQYSIPFTLDDPCITAPNDFLATLPVSVSGEPPIHIAVFFMDTPWNSRSPFKGPLDDRNWVMDFGAFKRNGIKEHLSYMFDHTTVVASDDPALETFRELESQGLIQLRVIEHVGCEKFAEYVYHAIQERLEGTNATVLRVECFENGKNSAIFERSQA